MKIKAAGGKAGAAKTLEYAWDDNALALFAKKLGKDAIRTIRGLGYKFV